MNEGKVITEFNQLLNLMFSGPGSDLRSKHGENEDLLALAGKIIKIDYSNESMVKQTLAQKLFAMKAASDHSELSDAELESAAGGLIEYIEIKDEQK